MDCKQEFNYNNEAGSKRERFRLEIRRKNIESYQKKVRTLHIQAENEQNETMRFSHEESLKQLRYDEEKEESEKDEYAFQENANENEKSTGEMLFSYELSEILNRLEQISLTDASKLCRVSFLDEFLSLIQDIPIKSTRFSDKIHQIIMKLCINELYWSEEFLLKLLHLLIEVEKLEMKIGGYLVSLSKCSLIEFKAILYRLMLSLNIFYPNQPKSVQNSNKPKENYAIKVLYNFMLAPPFIMHSNENLYPFGEELSPSWYVERILIILALVISPSKNTHARSILPRIDIQERNKEFLTILEIIYGLMNRVSGTENSLIIVCMENLEWKIMREVLHGYHQRSETMNESNFELKIKYKILEIVLSIVSFEDREEGIALNFVYTFLNPLLSIMVSDFQLYISKSEPEQVDAHLEKLNENNNKKLHKEPNELKKKYESLLLQVLSGLLSVHDELGDIPALKFIKERYTNFFENLFLVYEQHCIMDKKKINYMCLITEIILANLENSGEILGLSTFLEDLILERKTPNREILDDLLYDLLVFLRNWKSNNNPCILIATLKQNKILQALEEMGDANEKANKSVYEELIETIESCEI